MAQKSVCAASDTDACGCVAYSSATGSATSFTLACNNVYYNLLGSTAQILLQQHHRQHLGLYAGMCLVDLLQNLSYGKSYFIEPEGCTVIVSLCTGATNAPRQMHQTEKGRAVGKAACGHAKRGQVMYV